MKKFIQNVKQRSPHERREVAVRIAAVVTGVIFVGWVATLGVRLTQPHTKTAEQSRLESQVASVLSAFKFTSAANSLEVASTTNR